MRFGWMKLAAVAAIAPCMAACGIESTLPTGVEVPTGIDLNPETFLGGVQCSPKPGGMQSYVATLIDVSDLDHPFTLPSTPPTPCSEANDFRFLVVKHAYVAEIDGYEQAASALAPIGTPCADQKKCKFANGDPDNGSRHMILAGDPISPRWSGQCGAGPGQQAIASADDDVVMQNCAPLRDDHGAVTTGIEVDPTSSLGDHFACEDTGGIVSYFTIKAGDPTLAVQGELDCTTGRLPIWVYDVGVKAGREYHFTVTAHDDNDKKLATASCFASGISGLTVVAVCEELNP